MAATSITATKLALNTAAELPDREACDAQDGALITFDFPDHKALILIENANTTTQKTATIKKGTGIQGTKDLAVAVPASTCVCLTVESMKYLITSGANKGKILITGTADVKVACGALP